MAIHQEERIEMSGGFSKEIDAGAQQMIFDNLQRYQYQYPIKSTIREVVSNGIDSIREKKVAIEILVHNKPVSDYYEQREGEIYKDSAFDASYYNPQWLSDKNHVEIHYFDNGTNEKHYVHIIDYGVGLAGKRLKGYFNLGYSTKRLSRFPLGKFGLGAKSPLSTGAPFYTVISRHNGLEYAFNIYSHRTESIIPKIDLKEGRENVPYTLPGVVDTEDAPIVMYAKLTAEKNGVEIRLQVKQHHKQSYIEAVTQQLMYFDNVRLFVHEHDSITEVPVKASTIYEDDLIVMSTKAHYNKPHILLNGVNYGVIDFRELELEDKIGDIGIKVSPESVSVNPSREALIWDDTTRETVVGAFRNVLEIAEKEVSKQLQESDFFKWIRVCASASESKWFNGTGTDFFGRLSKIVDLKGMELPYSADSTFKFGAGVLIGLKTRTFIMTKVREGNKFIRKVDYSHKIAIFEFSENKPIIVQHTATSARKNKYLSEIVYPQGVINIMLPVSPHEDGSPITADEIEYSDEITSLLDFLRDRKRSEEAKRGITAQMARERVAKLCNFIIQSSEIIWYEDIEVPEEYKAKDTEEAEIEEDVKEESARESADERRKLLGLTNVAAEEGGVWKQLNFPVGYVNTWNNDEVYWGNKNDEGLLKIANRLTCMTKSNWTDFVDKRRKEYSKFQFDFPGFECSPYGWSTYANLSNFRNDIPLRIFRVSMANEKYYRDFPHISRFFKVIRNKTITMSNSLICWNTARIIKKSIDQLKFCNALEHISPKRYQLYTELTEYCHSYYKEEPEDTEALVNHLDNVQKFQFFVRDFPDDKEAITQLAQELFNPAPGVEITDGLAVDPKMIDLLNEMLDWSSNVHILMNLLRYNHEFTREEEQEIRNFMFYKQCPLD